MHSIFLLQIGVIGFLAQIIDGALGMGYGVASSTLLVSLGLGIYPPTASASIHTSEIFTTLVSGVSHFKFGNTRKDLLKPLISFGIIGGFFGSQCSFRITPNL